MDQWVAARFEGYRAFGGPRSLRDLFFLTSCDRLYFLARKAMREIAELHLWASYPNRRELRDRHSTSLARDETCPAQSGLLYGNSAQAGNPSSALRLSATAEERSVTSRNVACPS